jgi:hypothetical protein
MEGVGAHVGYVYKTNDQLWETFPNSRPYGLYTTQFYVADLGLDGVKSADDKYVQVSGIPNPAPAITNLITNEPAFARYKTIEAQVIKRQSHGWSLQLGGSYTWLHDFPASTGTPWPTQPNGPFDYDYSGYGLKAGGSWSAPWDIMVSSLLRFQSGPNYARTIAASNSLAVNPVTGATTSCGCTLASSTLYVEPYNSNRQDNIVVLDVRTEKSLTLGPTKLRLFLDLFNIFNKYAAETIGVATGTSYTKPTNILAPRTMRIGFRFLW